jgi:hypothetical protein
MSNDESATIREDVRWIVLLTAVMESVTCLLRFGFGMRSTRDTTAVAEWTGGIRIHHGYVGAAMLVLALASTNSNRCRPSIRRPSVQKWILRRVGGAMVASDLVHHFLVLWPITGDPQFDLVYPGDA